jgi:hypothetical protein
MAEKIKINLSNGQKKSSDEQFLKASRNWEKCSALGGASSSAAKTIWPFVLFQLYTSLFW